MNLPSLLALYDQEVRIDFTPPHVRKESSAHAIRWIRPAPGTNSIVYSRCAEPQVDALIQEQIACLASLGQPFVWTVFDHDSPPNLKDRLSAHGLIAQEVESFMVLDLREVPAALLQPLTADVRPVTRRENLAEFGSVMQAVWGGDPEQRERNLNNDLDLPGYMSLYLGCAQGVPVSTGRIHFFPNSHFAALRGAVTLPEYRGQGLYTAVLAARVQEAVRRGYRYLTIEASSMSGPIVSKYGFQYVEAVQDFRMHA